MNYFNLVNTADSLSDSCSVLLSDISTRSGPSILFTVPLPALSGDEPFILYYLFRITKTLIINIGSIWWVDESDECI